MANRILTINIRRYLVSHPRRNRHRKTFGYLRERISYYTKVPEENVLISQELNELVTKHNVKHMSPVTVSIAIENGKASVVPFKEGATATASAPKEKKQDGAQKPPKTPTQTAPKEKKQQKPDTGNQKSPQKSPINDQKAASNKQDTETKSAKPASGALEQK